MPRTCTICANSRRTEIDAALLKAEPLRRIVERCSVSMGSLVRHKDRHLPVTLAHAKEARETEMGESLMEQAHALHARALKILERAEAGGQLETALKAIREVRGILELLGKLDGQIKEQGAGPTHIVVTYIDKAIIAADSRRVAGESSGRAALPAASISCPSDGQDTHGAQPAGG